MERTRNIVQYLLASDQLEWLDPAYVTDWTITALLFFLSRVVESQPVFQRPIPFNDTSISFPNGKQQVPGLLSMMLSFWSPLGVALLNGLVTRSTIELHHGALTFLSGRFLMSLIVEMLKNRVGRLRPDFLDRCRWDAAAGACAGKADEVRDGRRSFPSGHSASAFAGLGFVALLLAHKLLAGGRAGSGFLASRLARASIVLAPLVLATWIAVSRVEDYRHHVEDVLAGSLIGCLCVLGTWHIYWPSPFASRQARASSASLGPRRVYGRRAESGLDREGFELARVDEFELEDDNSPGGRV